MSFDKDDDEEDAFLVTHISRALAGQGVAPVKSLTDPTLIDFRKRGRKADGPLPASNKPSSGGSGSGGHASLKRTRTAITAKHGQAVVKILSYGHGRQSVLNQAEYISRKGDLALEDQDGNLLEGHDDVKELVKDWSGDFSEFLNSRDSLHMQISVPEGSDREAAHDAVRAFASETFGDNHDYVFVRHDDTDNPHSHILVKTKGHNGKKLNPRKNDLARWRETYAREAEKRGILLDASSRKSRGQGRKGKKMATIKAQERGETPRAVVATAQEVIENPEAEHEGDQTAQARFEQERKEFARLGLALKANTEKGGDAAERAAAMLKRVHGHTVGMKPPASMRKQMQAMIEKNPSMSESDLIASFKAQEVAALKNGLHAAEQQSVTQSPFKPAGQGQDPSISR